MEKALTKSIWCICGPTAVGKTGVAIALAEALKTEVISFDSRQFYRELPVGTAAPNLAEQRGIKHHFILDRSIHEELNAASFAREAMQRIESLHQQYDTLILVGGSGLYLKALIEGFDPMPSVEPELRSELNRQLSAQGIQSLQEELAATDPEYYEEVDKQNPQRLIRALEVIRSSGKPFSSFRNTGSKALPFAVRRIGLNMERQQLYDRINRRVGLMVAQGLIEEAREMLPHAQLNALQTVGYKELFPYFKGEYDLNFALDEVRKNSRRYAKRQLTWFRRDTQMEWFHPDDWQDILNGAQ